MIIDSPVISLENSLDGCALYIFLNLIDKKAYFIALSDIKKRRKNQPYRWYVGPDKERYDQKYLSAEWDGELHFFFIRMGYYYNYHKIPFLHKFAL